MLIGFILLVSYLVKQLIHAFQYFKTFHIRYRYPVGSYKSLSSALILQ